MTIHKILDDQNEMRLDRYLRKNLEFNQALIEKNLRSHKILVNNAPAQASLRLASNDLVFVDDNLVSLKTAKNKKIIPSDLIKLVAKSVITASENLCVLNKPAGIAVQSGSKIKFSIDDILPKALKELDYYLPNNVSHKLVHRLDKETSGILLIALNNQCAAFLAEQFAQKLLSKKYYAILKGNIKKIAGCVTSILPDEKNEAITRYLVIANRKNYSLVEFSPVTGKKHQLRLHALELGHPILGDSKYDINCGAVDKLYLHARSIELTEKFYFHADFPDYFLAKVEELFSPAIKKQLQNNVKNYFNNL